MFVLVPSGQKQTRSNKTFEHWSFGETYFMQIFFIFTSLYFSLLACSQQSGAGAPRNPPSSKAAVVAAALSIATEGII